MFGSGEVGTPWDRLEPAVKGVAGRQVWLYQGGVAASTSLFEIWG